MSKLIRIIFIILIASFIGYYFRQVTHNLFVPKKIVNNSASNVETKTINCHRTMRLPNDPQYDRALSLITQKVKLIQENIYVKAFNDATFPYFQASTINCIHIDTGDIHAQSGAEGYFVFNSDRIKTNYFPIEIDESYDVVDDLTTAILLSHEITHVQQYIDELNNKRELSCIDKEVQAFTAQIMFVNTLNIEERKSIDLRIANDNNLNPQLQLISNLEEIEPHNLNLFCPLTTSPSGETRVECQAKKTNALVLFSSEIKQTLIQNNFYRKQCNL